MNENNKWIVTRRDFLKATGLAITGLSFGALFAQEDETDRIIILSFGIVTDAHFADKVVSRTRFYKESISKMTECVELMNDKKVDFLIELGDIKDMDDAGSEEGTLKFLDTIETIFKQFEGSCYHVIGNHDVDSISKKQFLSHIENSGIADESSYYSFDLKGLHFIILDANYNSDGSDYDHGKFDWTAPNIPNKEINWLKNDLASTSKPVIVFVHQQLNGEGNLYVNNATDVRQILQENKRVLAVFQGHHHAGKFSQIEDIYYYTLKAMVEGTGDPNNSYAIVDVYDDYSLSITGYRNAESEKME